MRRIFLVFFLWMSLGGMVAADDTVAQDFYRKLKSLSRPVEVRDTGMFTDGGTVFITLAGKTGDELSFCLDGQLGSGDRGALFVDATHPGSEGALKLPAGDATGDFIAELLQEWVASAVDAGVDEKERVRQFLQQMHGYRQKVGQMRQQGGMTRERAVDKAREKIRPLLVNGYKEIVVTEGQGKYRVTFVGIPFHHEGHAKQSDMNVDVSMDTGDVLGAEASNVRQGE